MSGQQNDVARELGHGAIAVHVDVSDDDSVAAMITAARDAFGGVDVLCNNAGVDGDIVPTADCSLENFERVLAVNTRGVFHGLRHAIPAMLERGGGSVINTASVGGQVSFPFLAAYCASKAAVLALTRSVAIEYGTQGIRSNAICPGVVRTALLESIQHRDPETAQGLIANAEAMTPLGRLGSPGEIATMAVFLASDESSFLTGAALAVDGGYTAA
ncbi:SDR family oxidoreductase [Mycobacterium talmoniae]